MSDLVRRQFVTCCAAGVCSAAFVSITPTAAAQSAEPDPKWLQSQLDSARLRYAKFIEVLGRELDEATKKRLLQALGRECAIQYRDVTWDKFKGDIKGFLKAVQEPSGWVAKAEYDEQAGTIRIVDRQKRCTCPLVQKSGTPADQCECTLGWQKETYSRILGRPVEAEIEESILRGGSRCVYLIKIKA
ncbi:MAG TPA: hypothetical protein VD837_19905 [Terriglobales bacterium]|nr:hypothetical protein [Terriglobales bacterium]